MEEPRLIPPLEQMQAQFGRERAGPRGELDAQWQLGAPVGDIGEQLLGGEIELQPALLAADGKTLLQGEPVRLTVAPRGVQ